MTDNNELTKKRFIELALSSYNNNRFTFTDFLDMGQLSLFHSVKSQFTHISFTMFGGCNGCERVMIRFGDSEALGYEENFPIVCIHAVPLSKKFADSLTHRDFLGAVMNLGIKRSMIGDIIVKDNEGYIFCTDSVGQYIKDNLTKVKHTPIKCNIADDIPENNIIDIKNRIVLTPSLRVDAVIAKVFSLSRSECIRLFESGRIFINGCAGNNTSYLLKQNDTVTVRGFGKFIFIEITKTTKKGNLYVSINYFGK